MEVEAKVIITTDEFLELLSKPFGPMIFSEDHYYKSPEGTLIRLRESESSMGHSITLTVKEKSIVDGKEVNTEKESQIVGSSGIVALLNTLGCTEYYRKEKLQKVIHCFYEGLECNVELVEVRKNPATESIKALEIEFIVEDSSVERAKELLPKVFKEYNLSSERFETKSWKELLGD